MDVIKRLWEWWKKDTIILFILFICLGAMLYTIASAQSYQNECNNYWSVKLGYNDYNVPENFNQSFDYTKLLTGGNKSEQGTD